MKHHADIFCETTPKHPTLVSRVFETQQSKLENSFEVYLLIYPLSFLLAHPFEILDMSIDFRKHT